MHSYIHLFTCYVVISPRNAAAQHRCAHVLSDLGSIARVVMCTLFPEIYVFSEQLRFLSEAIRIQCSVEIEILNEAMTLSLCSFVKCLGL